MVRLVSVFPDLRLIVGTMLRSFASMGSVVVLLALVMYVYAVLGYHLFHEADPAHWGDLALSVRTLFEVLTLEGWLELQAAVLPAVPAAWLFFGSYVLLAVFIVVNLFIAVILNNLETVKAARRRAAGGGWRRRAGAPHRSADRRASRRRSRPARADPDDAALSGGYTLGPEPT